MPIRLNSEEANEILISLWEEIVDDDVERDFIEEVKLKKSINRIISSGEGGKTFRYALPTQLLAKLTEPQIDSHKMMDRAGKDVANTRGFCKDTIARFSIQNDCVIGDSDDPYANTTLKNNEELGRNWAENRRNKKLANDLIFILDRIEEKDKPTYTERVFKQTLMEIRKRRERVSIAYSPPRRISHSKTISLINEYLTYK